MMMSSKSSPQYPAKGGGTIPGDPVLGVELQGVMGCHDTCYPVHGVQMQGIMDGRATCNQRSWRFGTWNVGPMKVKNSENLILL